MGSFSGESEFRKPENLNKTITKGEKKYIYIYIAELSLLKEFWRHNYTHVFLTAEADSWPTDTMQLLVGDGLVGCHSTRSNAPSVHARIDSTSYVRRSK